MSHPSKTDDKYCQLVSTEHIMLLSSPWDDHVLGRFNSVLGFEGYTYDPYNPYDSYIS